jgi:hypothetical protein
MKLSPFIVCVCLLFIVSVSAADKPAFTSKSRDGAIAVDGKYDDWSGNLDPFGDAPVSVQFVNDGDFLYMRLSATDPATRAQITRQGLIVWFDAGGGKKKQFGVRYPVIERGEGGGFGRRGQGGNQGDSGSTTAGSQDDSQPTNERVDILGPGKNDARELMRDHLQGVDVAYQVEQGTLQYELKVPIVKSDDHPYAIEAVAGKPIGVGLETPKMDRSSFQSGGGGFGGGGMGGRGGGGMGRGGGMGGRRGGGGGGGGRGGQQAKPLNLWGTLTLAAKQ